MLWEENYENTRSLNGMQLLAEREECEVGEKYQSTATAVINVALSLRSKYITKLQGCGISCTLWSDLCFIYLEWVAPWHVVDTVRLRKCQKLSAVSFLLSANNTEETIIHFAVSTFQTQGLFTRSFNTPKTEIYRLNGLYSRKITR